MPDSVVPSKKNGEPARLPAIRVEWDEQKQGCRLEFDNNDFRSWGFLESVLRMAADEAKFQGSMARAAAMQQQAMQAHQDAELRQRILRGQ